MQKVSFLWHVLEHAKSRYMYMYLILHLGTIMAAYIKEANLSNPATGYLQKGMWYNPTVSNILPLEHFHDSEENIKILLCKQFWEK